MITYYRDDKIKLEFSQEPQTITREICNPLLTSEQREEYLKKLNKFLISVAIIAFLSVFHNDRYSFVIYPSSIQGGIQFKFIWRF